MSKSLPEPSSARKYPGFVKNGVTRKKLILPFLFICSILAGFLGTAYFTWSTLLDIEVALPVKIAQQQRDITVLLQNVSDLVWQVKSSVGQPDPLHIKAVLERVEKVEAGLQVIRSSYDFDDVAGASAIHALINPAVFDINLWLTKGVYQMPPATPEMMALVDRRTTDAFNSMKIMYADAQTNAFDVLSGESRRIQNFRVSIVILLLLLMAIAVALIVQMLRMKKIEKALFLAYEESERANRSKSEFLANMSHELRTPLNSIIGYSQLISGEILGKLSNPKYVEYAKDVLFSGEHLLEVINDILDVSKIEAGEVTIVEEEIDIYDVVDAALKFVMLRGKSKGHNVQTHINLNEGRLFADERILRQILINLLSNAIKFTPESGNIIINAAFDDAQSIVLKISDTGIGIEPKDIPKALEPFGQIRENPQLAHEGTGLGLSLSKRLVEMHGGILSIDSRVGEGTTVTVWFPPERSLHAN